MRLIATVLALLLTASAAWAGLRVNGRDLPREQEVGIYCSVCILVVFGFVAFVALILAIVRYGSRRDRNDPE